MSGKSDGFSNLILAFVVLIGVIGVLGVSSLNAKVSVMGGVIVAAAVLESVLIIGGIALVSRRQHHSEPTGGSN